MLALKGISSPNIPTAYSNVVWFDKMIRSLDSYNKLAGFSSSIPLLRSMFITSGVLDSAKSKHLPANL